MNSVDIIVKKRDGEELTGQEIADFINGYTRGDVPDYQAAAWAMAVYFQGMSEQETTTLTQVMAASGEQIDLHEALPVGARIVDKHSSGGVGDKTTLVVGPIAAACGLYVGKMSGRGLSFTGGTIDKLESFTGWSPHLDEAQFRRQLADVRLVVAGQTANLAPADKALYALRDVTGTVPSLPLIASSIMSKKLAAGADAIVLDVKCGRGAFMPTQKAAQALARLMVVIGTRAGREVTALITQMDQPLGRAVGNTLEVQEAIATLQGQGPADFQALAEQVAAEMFILGRPRQERPDFDQALARVREAISSGQALAKLRTFVQAQGGNPEQVDHPGRLPQAPVQLVVEARQTGYIAAVDSRAIGHVTVHLGGGRHRKDEAIDHRVGVLVQAKIGQYVQVGEPLCVIHAADEAAAGAAREQVLAAYTVQDAEVEPLPVVYARVLADDMQTAPEQG